MLWTQSFDKKKYRWTSLISWHQFLTLTLPPSWPPHQHTCRQVFLSHLLSLVQLLEVTSGAYSFFLLSEFCYLHSKLHCDCIVGKYCNCFILFYHFLIVGWEWLRWTKYRSSCSDQNEKCLCVSKCVKLTGTWWVFVPRVWSLYTTVYFKSWFKALS